MCEVTTTHLGDCAVCLTWCDLLDRSPRTPPTLPKKIASQNSSIGGLLFPPRSPLVDGSPVKSIPQQAIQPPLEEITVESSIPPTVYILYLVIHSKNKTPVSSSRVTETDLFLIIVDILRGQDHHTTSRAYTHPPGSLRGQAS